MLTTKDLDSAQGAIKDLIFRMGKRFPEYSDELDDIQKKLGGVVKDLTIEEGRNGARFAQIGIQLNWFRDLESCNPASYKE